MKFFYITYKHFFYGSRYYAVLTLLHRHAFNRTGIFSNSEGPNIIFFNFFKIFFQFSRQLMSAGPLDMIF